MYTKPNTARCPYCVLSYKMLYTAAAMRTSRHNDVIMSAMASQITSVSIDYSKFVQAQVKENIKAPRRWPL